MTKTVAALAAGALFVGAASAVASPRTVTLSAADRVAVSGARVAYADMTRSAGWDIFVHDGVASRTVRIGGVGDQVSADIDGDIVVFSDFAEGDSNIAGYDLIERRRFSICAEAGNQTRPRISGDWVVWSELGVGSTGRVLAYNLATSEQIVVADSLAANAEIAGTTVVFEDHTGGISRISVFDLAEKTRRTLVAAGDEDVMPSTDGTWIAWATASADGYDVVYQRLDDEAASRIERDGEQTLPLVADGVVSFTEHVPGRPLGTVSVELASGRVTADDSSADVAGFDSDGRSTARLVRASGDRWTLDARVPRISLLARIGATLESAWRTVAPARYYAWSPDAPTFSANGVEQAAALLEPTMTGAVVSGPASVTVTWNSPRSLRGVKDFDVYRHERPITPKNLSSAEKVADGIVATRFVDVFKESSATTLRMSSFYYAVVARDHDGTLSPLSASVTPNPHGAGMYTISGVDACGTCHNSSASSESTAGALGALSADRCYDCHGSTARTSTRGAGSLFDAQAGFRDDTTNTAGPALASGGSIHRNATMVQRQRECTACHDAHARPYAVDGKGRYDKSASSSKMLRTQVGSSAGKVKAWTDGDPAGVRVCLSCHGSNVTPIALVGGTAAYGNTGGDHAGSGDRTYARSAHAAIETSGSKAAIQCLVCHNEHGSATRRLVDYRSSNTTDPAANRQANLCYRCHNSGTTNTWNGRDVRTEFTRASRHPSFTSTATASASATCVSCHNTHFAQRGDGVWDTDRVADPRNTAKGVSDTTSFCLRCHSTTRPDGSLSIAAISAASELVPYEVRMRPSNLWPYFTGWGKAAEGAEFTKSGHATASVSEGRAGCETCHDPHASDFSALTAWTRPVAAVIEGGLTGERANSTVFADRSKEENLCYQCHGNGRGGSGKAAGAKDVLTVTQSGYSHPIGASDMHRNSETAADLATNRHAECADCHDPHAARSGLHRKDSSTAGEALRGAVGVKPVWAGGVWSELASLSPKRIVPGSGDDYEAYLCLKCHSTQTTFGVNSSAGFRTNVAREFNPRNLSYHRVLGEAQSGVRQTFEVAPAGSGAKARVRWTFPDRNVFRAGYDRDSMMTCTACHGSSEPGTAGGPHGSSSKYLLDPQYPTDWNSTGAHLTRTAPGMPETLVCSKCHSLTDGEGDWSNNVHAEHAAKGGSAAYCRNCHVGVPHGWKRPRLLGYTTDEAPYNTWTSSTGAASSGDWGLTRVKVKATTSPQGWTAGDCYAGCHAVHRAPVRSYWP